MNLLLLFQWLVVIGDVPKYEVKGQYASGNGESSGQSDAELMERKATDRVLFHHCAACQMTGSTTRRQKNLQGKSNLEGPHFPMLSC